MVVPVSRRKSRIWVPPPLYITQKRLVKARELMDSGMRATEACYRCGWRSYSSFTRAYSKHLGTTPTGRLDVHHAREADFE